LIDYGRSLLTISRLCLSDKHLRQGESDVTTLGKAALYSIFARRVKWGVSTVITQYRPGRVVKREEKMMRPICAVNYAISKSQRFACKGSP